MVKQRIGSNAAGLPNRHKRANKADAERRRLISAAAQHVDAQVGAHMKAHGENDAWATVVRYHYHRQLRDERPSKLMPALDDSTRQLVRQWVAEAREATGLQPKPRPQQKKPKKGR